MTAYKCLDTGAVSPFTGFEWPQPTGHEPGSWVDAGAITPCRHGIYACTADDVPYWLQDELWEIELAGDIQRIGHKYAARRGRLLRRVSAWNTAAARRFALVCADRVEALVRVCPEVSGHAADAASIAAEGRSPAAAGFIAARAAELAGGIAAYEAERALQVGWFVEQLGIDAS